MSIFLHGLGLILSNEVIKFSEKIVLKKYLSKGTDME